MRHSKRSVFYHLICLTIVLVANTGMLICFWCGWHWWIDHDVVYGVVSCVYLIMLAAYWHVRDNCRDGGQTLFRPIHDYLDIWRHYTESSKWFGYSHSKKMCWRPRHKDCIELVREKYHDCWCKVDIHGQHVGSHDYRYTLKILDERGAVFYEEESYDVFHLFERLDKKLKSEGYQVVSYENEYGFVRWRYKDCDPRVNKVRHAIAGIFTCAWYLCNIIVVFAPVFLFVVMRGS